jgi:aminoglycoside phosphotransferase (APT) family kinase protein
MDEELTDATLQRMIQTIDSEWELREATPAESGFCSVYRVIVETPSATRTHFLKASSDGNAQGISTDARILTVLQKHTSIPVPEVVGVVDDHSGVRSPFYLMDSMAGSDVPYEEVGWISDTVLRTVARQLGAYLGELHLIDAVESFGHVNSGRSQQLVGGHPSGTVQELDVVDGFESWQAYLSAWVERELERHATSQFATLTPRLESWCREQVENITDPFSPVLGRNDHGFHNLLIDPDTGEITAMLDWAYTLAVTPAFDFQFGEYR